ncbi:MAG: carboxypeptidase-like regulatory domain-containing protein, partial [Candidatus Dormibacteria bacterium]
MRRAYLLLFLSLFVCFPPPGSAQELSKKVLSGYVREEGTGHVLSAVHIELQNAMGTPIASVYSDGNGQFEFDDIGGGDCYVSIQQKGYASTREFVRPDGSGHVFKDIFLRPLGSDSSPNSVNPVSERELGIPEKARDSFQKGIRLVVEKSDYRGAVAQFE